MELARKQSRTSRRAPGAAEKILNWRCLFRHAHRPDVDNGIVQQTSPSGRDWRSSLYEMTECGQERCRGQNTVTATHSLSSKSQASLRGHGVTALTLKTLQIFLSPGETHVAVPIQ